MTNRIEKGGLEDSINCRNQAQELLRKHLTTAKEAQTDAQKCQTVVDAYDLMIEQKLNRLGWKTGTAERLETKKKIIPQTNIQDNKTMLELYEIFGNRFNANCWTDTLAGYMAWEQFQPNSKGVYTVLEAHKLCYYGDGTKPSYMTIYNAMRKIAKVYGLSWPTHSAGMKVN